MQLICDLHIHSKYSRATSARLDLFEISRWASKKGIDIVATADWTHPLWLREIKTHLKESSPGLFTLKKKPDDQKRDVYFILSTEVSSIYSQGGKTRRVHNLIYSPSIETCEKIIFALKKKGAKLMSDGRPITGISSKDMLELTLGADKNALFVPAHVWTPWFSLYGSFSGFDSVEECFGDLSKHIYAVETGLSSDPIMNWGVEDLQNMSLLSSSDAHSGAKLGREATVFSTINPDQNGINNQQLTINNICFDDISDAIKQKKDSKFKISYTIEFFPEEGKYHWSGHRNCNVSMPPEKVIEMGGKCPKCSKPLTIGVEDRVMQLRKNKNSVRTKILENKNGVKFVFNLMHKRPPFVSLVPLVELLGQVLGSPIKAQKEYDRLIENLGSEFEILLKMPLDQIRQAAGEEIAATIEAVRQREVETIPGYDGVFGKVITGGQKKELENQTESQATLF